MTPFESGSSRKGSSARARDRRRLTLFRAHSERVRRRFARSSHMYLPRELVTGARGKRSSIRYIGRRGIALTTGWSCSNAIHGLIIGRWMHDWVGRPGRGHHPGAESAAKGFWVAEDGHVRSRTIYTVRRNGDGRRCRFPVFLPFPSCVGSQYAHDRTLQAPTRLLSSLHTVATTGCYYSAC
jgi:hypothetical protein